MTRIRRYSVLLAYAVLLALTILANPTEAGGPALVAAPAGRHEARWNGDDDHGRQVASGVYFCRMEAGAFRETGRMTLVR